MIDVDLPVASFRSDARRQSLGKTVRADFLDGLGASGGVFELHRILWNQSSIAFRAAGFRWFHDADAIPSFAEISGKRCRHKRFTDTGVRAGDEDPRTHYLPTSRKDDRGLTIGDNRPSSILDLPPLKVSQFVIFVHSVTVRIES